MGYDLYGLTPNNEPRPDVNWNDELTVKAYFAYQKNTKGAYFRSNVWFWYPLWDYVSLICDDILSEEDMINGNSNAGHIIDKKKAKQISSKINKAIKSGELNQYSVKHEKKRVSLPKEECYICNGVGTRKEWFGWQTEAEWLKYHDTLEPSSSSNSSSYEWANKCNGCNGCKGTGKKEHSSASYRFDEDLVKEFADFCKHSGGFQIS